MNIHIIKWWIKTISQIAEKRVLFFKCLMAVVWEQENGVDCEPSKELEEEKYFCHEYKAHVPEPEFKLVSDPYFNAPNFWIEEKTLSLDGFINGDYQNKIKWAFDHGLMPDSE